MKKVHSYAIAALGIISLAACNNDETATVSTPEYITVQANIGALTKVQTTGNTAEFETGDTISLYAWTGSSESVPATKVVNGVRNGLGADGKWTPKTQMLWADMVSKHYFIGIYPARTVTDFTADSYTLDPMEYEASDLLIATSLNGIKATNDPVSLVFDHVLAKLNVNLTFRNQWETTPTVTAVEVTAKKTGSVNYLSKTLTASGSETPSGIALTKASDASWSGLQVPQTGVRTITIKIDGKDYVFTHTDDIPLAGGQYTTVNLIVGRDQIEMGTMSINNWKEGTTIDNGEAQTDED